MGSPPSIFSGHLQRPVFTLGDRTATVGDILRSADFRGTLQDSLDDLTRSLAAVRRAEQEELELEAEAVQEASESFRYEHDLITTEETEDWVSERDISMEQFSDFFARRHWLETVDTVEFEAARLSTIPDDVRELLRVELFLSGAFETLACDLAWRMAALAVAEPGDDAIRQQRDPLLQRLEDSGETVEQWLSGIGADDQWLEEQLRMEGAYQCEQNRALTPAARGQLLVTQRLQLLQFELETLRCPSLEAAREAILCLREDPESIEALAEECGGQTARARMLVEDLPDSLQQSFISAPPGHIIGPEEIDDGFEICRIISKSEPSLDNEEVTSRIDALLMQAHFTALTRDLRWHIRGDHDS